MALAACAPAPESASANASEGDGWRAPVAAVEVRPRDLSRVLNLSGTVRPLVAIRLASRASGTVAAVHVEEGDRVDEGSLLAELDVSEQRAELARADARTAEARFEYARMSELSGRGLVSDADYQRARAALSVAEAERELWRTRVAFGRIVAPRATVVTARHIEPGEAVQAQQVLFELAALDALVLHLGVSELDVVHLGEGQTVLVRLDAMPDLPLQASLRRIFPAADSGNRLVTVEIALPEDAAERGVRPGFLARVRMPVDNRPEALAVPSAAIGEDNGGRYLFIIDNGRLERRGIETGVTRGEWTEVRDGLAAGDVVLATQPIDMREGQPVRVVGWRG
ncbi:MAG TPA: efflux RND transporter periplasmic adaptor subunit [Xanthomonadaceae bacterium]|nr:efflux RND transporter periplasmic adaptor subunit [Xanthomonadaceae bacterium]